MTAYLLDSLAFLLRWLHVVAAIAWIGESFYFVMLDRTLQRPRQPSPGLFGESWSVHGGGFYLKQKFMPAPPELPETLHWSKWKSYTTWLSGFALLALLYLTAPGVWLVDPRVAALSDAAAVGWVLALLAIGWLGYDLLCRAVGFRDGLLGALVALWVVAIVFTASQLFAGRAAFLLSGAVLATIMSANVFFVIIPGQRRIVAQLARGEAPDPLPGLQGKQRSVHNTYFTLPVVFAMISVHYPAAHAHPYHWVLLLVFMAAGALIRQFFVLWHSGARAWWLLAVGGLLLALAFGWMAPTPAPAAGAAAAEPALPLALQQPHPDSSAVLPLFAARCGSCHATRPTLMPAPPKGLVFDQPAVIEQHAALIHQQTVVLRMMPPGNLSGMTEAERDALRRWFEGLR